MAAGEPTINPSIFRNYDIRGRADQDLTPAFVRLFGFVVGRYFQKRGAGKVLVGQDNRKSSGRIRDQLNVGLATAGLEIIEIGEVITPIFYYARELYDINAGLMITASHNPGAYNGFKIAFGHATLYGEEIAKLREGMEEIVERGEIPDFPPKAPAESVEKRDPVENYLEMLTSKLEMGPHPLTVAVDCGNGTASLFAVDFLKRLGCEVVPLYCESNPDFPNHHPDPVKSENLEDLREVVFEEEADLGVSFDGDGDRIGVIGDRGSVVWGDTLMCIFWREILKKYPGADVIVEVKCSQALVDEVERLGGKPQFYKTGHSFIKARMKEIGAIFTGEMSGHMFFADEYYGFDDALYAAGRLLRILSNTEKPLSAMIDELPHYYSTAETRIPCPDQDKFRVVEELTSRFKDEFEVIDVDGARVQFPDGWGLVRASNTQPAIVARCEGKTEQALERIADRLKTELASFEEVEDFSWEY